MSYEISQNGNVIFRGWEDPSIIECKLQSALAELERVKAERDELTESLDMAEAERNRFRDLCNTAERMRQEKIKELSSLKSRLPVNADGQEFFLNDQQWYWGSNAERCECEEVQAIENGDNYEKCNGDFMITMGTISLGNKDLFSTAESCRKAIGGE